VVRRLAIFKRTYNYRSSWRKPREDEISSKSARFARRVPGVRKAAISAATKIERGLSMFSHIIEPDQNRNDHSGSFVKVQMSKLYRDKIWIPLGEQTDSVEPRKFSVFELAASTRDFFDCRSASLHPLSTFWSPISRMDRLSSRWFQQGAAMEIWEISGFLWVSSKRHSVCVLPLRGWKIRSDGSLYI